MTSPSRDLAQVAAPRDQPVTLFQYIERMKPEIARALPKHMDADRMARLAITLLRKNPDLLKCTQVSFGACLMTATALGLEPGVNDEAYLIPYKVNGRDMGRECTFVVGYQGFVKLFWQHPLARHIDAQAVHERDEFDYAYGLNPFLTHKPAAGDRGDIVNYYAVAALSTGAKAFVVLTPDEIKALRQGKVGPDPKFKGGDPMHWMERKGLALDTPIPTPIGWTTMGDLTEGGTVLDMDGQPVRVRETSPIKHIGCYRVTFGNGQSIVCDEEHYWLARIGWKQGRTKWNALPISALSEAKQAGRPVTMPVAAPLELPVVALPVDPWVLGFWLGDGSATSARVTVNLTEVAEVRAGIERGGYVVGALRPDPRSNAVSIGIKSSLMKNLVELGVAGHKHVPGIYLRGSVDHRLALLRGLMDADGNIDDPRGRVYFTNTNEALADAVAELARSLGEQVSRNVQTKTGFGKTVTAYVVMWQPTVCPFTLDKKARRFRNRIIPSYRTVKTIERIESVPTRCISVDSPTRTYLAGWDMIPTHNTAIRQLVKLLPKSVTLAQALRVDEQQGSALAADPAQIVAHEPPAELDTGGAVYVDGEPVNTVTGELEPAEGWPDVAEVPAS